MELSEYNDLLPTLPREEQRAFQTWFVEHQELVSWETFKSQGYRHQVAVKEDIEKHILEVTGKPQQLKLAFMPTTMARTSPFFVMGKQEMKDRPVYQDLIIENAWGRITISGPKLSIYDESVLLALLVLTRKNKTDDFKTNFSELCELMGNARGKNTYAAIAAALKRLTKATIDTELYKLDSAKKEVSRSIIGHIVDEADLESDGGKIRVRLNPSFLTIYAANLTTSLDVAERAKIKGDTAKAAYRFIKTHNPGTVPFGLLTLCHGLNLSVEQPLAEIRKQIKAALAELKRSGHLQSWRVDKTDRVFLTK